MYKSVVKKTQNGLRATALVGTNSIILGWNVQDSFSLKSLMGFSIRRTAIDPKSNLVMDVRWLNGQKRFKSVVDDHGFDVPSIQAPFQRFRWNDYAVKPGFEYEYEIFPMYGKPGNLSQGAKLTIKIESSSNKARDYSIYFNRGVTSSMAYLRRFGNQVPKDGNPEILNWLSRGLKESLIDFIDKAKSGEELKVAIYEFHDHEVADSLKNAKDRGVDVKIVYDYVKPEKKIAKENVHVLKHFGLFNDAVPRTTVNISHNKFVIRVKNDRAQEVWVGTSNFTFNGFYHQTNGAIIIHPNAIAQRYLEFFRIIENNPTKANTKLALHDLHKSIGDNNPGSMFSPVSQDHILEAASELIRSAKSCVLISAPFGLHPTVVEALEANDKKIIEYGVANSTVKKKLMKTNRNNTRMYTASRLETYMGKKWDAKAFGNHKIHTKSIVIDPWSNNTKVLFGSANFSRNSCRNNDENSFLIEGDSRISAIIANEFMRIYDHYKSRYFINTYFNDGVQKEHYLNEDTDWMRTSFDPNSNSHKYRDRIVF